MSNGYAGGVTLLIDLEIAGMAKRGRFDLAQGSAAASSDQIKRDCLKALNLHQGSTQSAHFMGSLNKAAGAYPNQEGPFWYNVVTNLVNLLVSEKGFVETSEHANIANAFFESPLLLAACINSEQANPRDVLAQALDLSRDSAVCARCQGKQHLSATCTRVFGNDAGGGRGRGRGRSAGGTLEYLRRGFKFPRLGALTKGQVTRNTHLSPPPLIERKCTE